eukprot:8263050-Heterocapsa_arctica.AAC.1
MLLVLRHVGRDRDALDTRGEYHLADMAGAALALPLGGVELLVHRIYGLRQEGAVALGLLYR